MAPPTAEVLRCVPHRAPILRVLRIEANDGASARVVGREPGGPGALPWALGAIEGLAQSSAALLAHGMTDAALAVARGMLVAVRDFEVRAEAPPGGEIAYCVTLVRRLGATVRVRGRAEANGQILAAGELTLWVGTTGR
jgi:predicted hotdog family 3-hydroxylacyl-ACP dehydratase